MQHAMDMSLDEYINSFQKSHPETNLKGNEHKEESKFKEGRRELDDNEDEDDDLIINCQEDDYVSLAPRNIDTTLSTIDSNDLRHKIGRFPSASSQQWRLMHPNVVHTRPAGMPPLIPTDSMPNGISGNRNNRRYNNNKYRNGFGRQNYNGNNNNNSSNFRNNGRIQRFGNNNRPNINGRNIKTVLQQLKDRNPMILYTEDEAPDLTIEARTTEQDRRSTTTISIPQLIKSNVQQVKLEPETTVAAPNKGSEAIKSLLGLNEVSVRNEMIPALASTLLDFLNGVHPAVHKPQYDMKIQREIHDIQKKPLLYKCPGGEVVSSDGVGIPNCRVQPKASGVSLNNRFA